MEKLDNISSDVADIKTTLKCHVEAQTTFEAETLSSRAVTKEQLEGTRERIKDHEERLKKLEDAVREFTTTNKAVRWIAGVLAVSVVSLIWALITGQATIVLR